MKKSPLRGISAALTLGALALVSACGGSASGGGGSSDDPVRIAFIAPLSGSNAKSAQAMVKSAELAVEQANKSGDLGGLKLELKVYDDELSPDVASRVATRAISVDGAKVLVGGLSSAEGLAIKEVAERTKVPYLASASSAAGITADAKFSFRVAATALDQANATVDIARALGKNKASILHDNGAVGPALAKLFAAHADKTGLALSGSSIEFPLAGTDMSGPVKSALGQAPEVVLIGGSTGADHGLLAKTMVEQGLNVPIIGLVGIGFPDAFAVGGDAYDKLPGAYFPSSVDITKPAFLKYKEAYEAKNGAVAVYPDAMVQSYDSVALAIEGLKVTKGEGGQALADAINKLPPLDGAAGRTGTSIQFGESHDGLRGGFLVVYRAAQGKNSFASDVKLAN